MSDDVDVVRRLFDAVEARDLDRVLDCYCDDVEIAEAEVLPYGGVWRGREGAAGHAEAFMRAWGGLQGPEESRLDEARSRAGDQLGDHLARCDGERL